MTRFRGLDALLSGFVFAVGLGVAGMTRPAKVQAFLDVRAWDPSLAFVMAGAVGITALLYRVIRRHRRPEVAARVAPRRGPIDRALVLGAVLFGVGWGLVGYCPGPAMVSLPTLDREAWVFVLAMLAGMFVARQRRR